MKLVVLTRGTERLAAAGAGEPGGAANRSTAERFDSVDRLKEKRGGARKRRGVTLHEVEVLRDVADDGQGRAGVGPRLAAQALNQRLPA